MGSLHNQRGSVLVISYLLILLIITYGSATMVRSVHEQDIVERNQNTTSAFQLAEAALDQAITNLRTNNSSNIASTALGGGTYWAELTYLGNMVHRVNAHGLAGEQRDIEAFVQRSGQSVFQYPLFGDNTVDLKKGTITDSYNSSQASYNPNSPGNKGHVATNSTASQSIRLRQGTAVNGQVIVGPGMTNPTDAVDKDETTLITWNPPIASASQPLVFSPVDTTGMSCSSNLSLPKNATFTFYETSSPYCYNQINADQGSVIAVSGNVKVYANQVDFDKNLSVNASGTPPQFILSIYGTSDVVIDKEGTFVGAIYAPDARVRLKKVVELYGALAAQDVEIDKESKFHYDEALKSASGPAGSYTVTIKSWREP